MTQDTSVSPLSLWGEWADREIFQGYADLKVLR